MLNKWIDVNEEVPSVNLCPVLVWIKDDGCTVGYFERKMVLNSMKQEEMFEQWLSIFDHELYNVIAWQALPFGPNGEAAISRDLIIANTAKEKQ